MPVMENLHTWLLAKTLFKVEDTPKVEVNVREVAERSEFIRLLKESLTKDLPEVEQ